MGGVRSNDLFNKVIYNLILFEDTYGKMSGLMGDLMSNH